MNNGTIVADNLSSQIVSFHDYAVPFWLSIIVAIAGIFISILIINFGKYIYIYMRNRWRIFWRL
jgi:hypothetical protein